MSTFSLATSGTVVSPGVATKTVGGITGPNLGTSGQLDVAIGGTDAQFHVNVATAFTYSLDGGATWATYAGTTGSTVTWTPISGASDVTRHVILRGGGGDAVFDATTFVVVTGAAPTAATPAGMSTSVYAIDDFAAAMPRDDSLYRRTAQAGQTGYTNFGAEATGDGGVRFRATCTGLMVYGFGAPTGMKYRVWVDGVDSGTAYSVTDATNGGSWSWVPLGAAYDGGAEHEYIVSAHVDGTYIALAAVMVVGGTMNTAALANAGCIGFLGDSIVAGFSGSPPASDTGKGWACLFARAKKKGCLNAGLDGAKWASSPPAGVQGRNNMVIGNSPPNPTMLVYCAGVNDATAGVAASSVQAAITSALQLAVNAYGAIPIYVVEMLPTTDPTASAARPAYAAAYVAGVAAVSPNASIHYVPTDGVIDPSGADTIDGKHLSDQGNAKLAALLLLASATGRAPRSYPRGVARGVTRGVA